MAIIKVIFYIFVAMTILGLVVFFWEVKNAPIINDDYEWLDDKKEDDLIEA